MIVTDASELFPTAPYAPWVVWLGFILVVGTLAALGWSAMMFKLPPAPRSLLAHDTRRVLSQRQQRLFLTRLDEIESAWTSGDTARADVHLEVAALLRAYGTKVTGANLETATTGEIRAAWGQFWPQYCAVLEACETSSFAPGCDGPISVCAQARQLITANLGEGMRT